MLRPDTVGIERDALSGQTLALQQQVHCIALYCTIYMALYALLRFAFHYKECTYHTYVPVVPLVLMQVGGSSTVGFQKVHKFEFKSRK